MPRPPTVSSRRPRVAAAVLLLALVAAYASSLRGHFLWDDDLHITANPTIVGPLGLKEIWTTARANYFPLVLTNFRAQHALWGLQPLGYRLVTLAFHAGAALLLWRVLLRLRVPGAWLGAALWALHPVQVESVAWICELKNTQSAVFFLAAIACWLRWLEADARRTTREVASTGPAASGGNVFYAVALACALFALLSKPSTVMLPVALALGAWWVRGRLAFCDLLRLVPFFALSGIAAGWTIWEQKFHSGAVGPEWSQTLPERAAIAGRAIAFYLGKLAWPEPLIFIYPRWSIDAARPGTFLAAALVLVALAMLWRGRHGRLRPVLFAATYFVALLFPVLGFFSVYFFRYSFVGDHFQYLASMGPLALVGAGISRLAPRHAALAGAALLAALGLATARQGRVYLSNEALWRDTVAHNPAAVMAWLNLADTLTQAARYDEAIATFRRALEIKPTDPDGWNDLGNVLVLVGRAPEAIAHFERALALKPDFAEAHSNFGNALRQLGRSDEAIAHYRRAVELKPADPAALSNLGAELAERGQPEQALPVLESALRLKPTDAATHDTLGGALRLMGRFDAAIAQHREALRLDPQFAEAHVNLGRALVAAGRAGEALPHFERALQLRPALTHTRSHYAVALTAAGRPADALSQLEAAVREQPEAAEPRVNLGTALAQSGRPDAAIPHFQAALRLAPDSAPAHANLGNAFAALGHWTEAVPQFAAAATLQPHSATAQAQLAIALVNAEELAAAVPHFEAALRLAPDAAEIHDNFGQVLSALGRRREAFEQLEEAARLRRTPPAR